MDVTIKPIIDYVRQYSNASTDDEFNGVVYWTDDQLYEVLLRHSEPLVVRFDKKHSNVYQHSMNRAYMLNPTLSYEGDFTYNILSGIMTLHNTTDLPNSLYVNATRYNLWHAIAEIWEQKAQQRYDYANFRAGTTTQIQIQQEYQHCVDLARVYRSRIATRFKRSNR